MVTNAKPVLFQHDPTADVADIRVHVCVKVARCYVFRVADIPPLTFHPSFTGPTSEGRLVPWDRIPGIKFCAIDRIWLEDFPEDESGKGAWSEAIVERLLNAGDLPYPARVFKAHRRNEQYAGIDLWIPFATVQVKCDYNGGEKSLGGTGNLYIETAERNPRGIR